MTSSVTRAPALRKIFASPGCRPSMVNGSIRVSMQVTIASLRAARPARPASGKSRAYAALASSTSANSSCGTSRFYVAAGERLSAGHYARAMHFDALLPVGSLGDTAAFARNAEERGIAGLWTAEAAHDAFLPLMLAAEHTERAVLGTGIAIAFARTPMITAVAA